MTIATVAQPRLLVPSRVAVWALTRIEAGRMLRHPAPWLGLALSAWIVFETFRQPWSGAGYTGLVGALSPLLLGVSVASVSAFGREHLPVAEDGPMRMADRSMARLLAGVSLVGMVTVVVLAGAVWLRWRGGLDLGDEPGRTLHAHYTLPELLQPALLACFAVAVGAAVVHVVRQRVAAAILVFFMWFLLGSAYWMFNGSVARWLTPVQSQPISIEIGAPSADPSAFPADWLLSAPGEFQDHWARLVVSPAMAAWHDVYILALTLLAIAVAVPGRARRTLVIAGVFLAVVAVVLQGAVNP